MRDHHCCNEMRLFVGEQKVSVVYVAKFREYGIRLAGCEESYQLMRYCPWCGTQLPTSLRHEWFDRLEEMGKEPNDALPPELLSDTWWKSEGL